ncbi:uncharacterized protein LOC120429608 [Culex pipiens pallens]|uniref:uncharacterized protein LOC120429608 n=1 Tax=Culex pipiens pallens TaxID=42434 RepID=UPI001953AB66|nr:uncharacterized protein LOC120429608 [Culex pipiens pallens]
MTDRVPVVPHLRSTDLIQPLRETQPDTVHFKGTFPLRRFKSNPDLVALRVVEQNRYDRIPSPPVCGLDVHRMHRKLERINPPRDRRVEKTRLYNRPSSMELPNSTEKTKCDAETDVKEFGQLCQEFSNQVSLLK